MNAETQTLDLTHEDRADIANGLVLILGVMKRLGRRSITTVITSDDNDSLAFSVGVRATPVEAAAVMAELAARLSLAEVQKLTPAETDHSPNVNEKVAEGARTVNIRGCSACGGAHEGLTALPLPLGHAWGVGIRWTHATTCPHSLTTVYVSFDDEPAPAPSAEPTSAPRRFGKWVNGYADAIPSERGWLCAFSGGTWGVWPSNTADDDEIVQGQVPEVDPNDPRPILDRARAAAEAAAVREFGPCKFGCES